MRRGNQRGSTAVEVAIVVPGLMLFVGLMLAGGRVWFARATLTDAAYAAARAASLSSNSAQANRNAQRTFDQAVSTAGLHCRDRTLTTDATGLTVAPGRAATVSVSARCTVPFDDLLIPAPAEMALEVEGHSPLDRYRERG